jgi:hypothetical protein
MAGLVFILALAAQEESVDSLVRRLGSDNPLERERAGGELRRRGERAMEALEREYLRASDPVHKERLHKVLEGILGHPALTPERIGAIRVTGRVAARQLGAAAAELSRLAKVPIEVQSDRAAAPELEPLEFADAPLNRVLQELARRVSGLWVVEARRVLIVAAGRVGVRVVDVRDLVWPLMDDPPIPLDPVRGELEDGGDPSRIEFTGEDLANLVKAAVHKGRWEEADGKSSQFLNGFLVLRNDEDVLRDAEAYLRMVRQEMMREIRVELWAYAARPGDEGTPERLAEDAAEGKRARLVAAFDRTVHDKRRVALSSVVSTGLVERYDENGQAVTALYTTGTKANLRAALSEDRRTVRASLGAGWSRLIAVERKKEEHGEVHLPTIAHHVLRSAATVEAGKASVLGRLGGTRIVEGLTEIVVVGRFTPVERK